MSAHRHRLLVVEDHQDLRECLAILLELKGFDVVTAADGSEALDRLGGAAPCAILLDAHMPGMDGLEFRDVQLADPRLAAIPVIALTADAHVSRCAQELRVRDYLGKPIDVDRLLALVALHCADCASARRRRWSTG